MSHQENYYRKNTDYANFLEDWDDDFYAKYSEALCPKQLAVLGKVLQNISHKNHHPNLQGN